MGHGDCRIEADLCPAVPLFPQKVILFNGFTPLPIMIYFLNTINPNHTFRQKLENLFAKYPSVDRAATGFPAGWQSEPLWN
jgi:hypothetical protein